MLYEEEKTNLLIIFKKETESLEIRKNSEIYGHFVELLTFDREKVKFEDKKVFIFSKKYSSYFLCWVKIRTVRGAFMKLLVTLRTQWYDYSKIKTIMKDIWQRYASVRVYSIYIALFSNIWFKKVTLTGLVLYAQINNAKQYSNVSNDMRKGLLFMK